MKDWLTRYLARHGRTIAAAVPVVLVNAVAFAGQLAFLREHLPWSLAGQVMVALALESVAIYLAWQAHLAQLANDSALRLRLSAYAFALVIATMNYSHYAAPHWRPTFAAVAVGLMSAASPWLWGIHSRRMSRDRLMATGLIEPHALRLGITRWAWHPIRSAQVMYAATWEGVTDPSVALEKYPGKRKTATSADKAPDVLPAGEGGEVKTETAPVPVTVREEPAKAVKPAVSAPKRVTSPRHRNDKLIRLLLSSPDMTEPEVASRAGVSVSTVSRQKKRMREAAMAVNGNGKAAG